MAKYISTKIVNAAQWDPTDTEPMREFLLDVKNKIRKISLVQEVKISKLDTPGALDPNALSLSIETASSKNAITAKPTAYVVQTAVGLTSMSATSFEEQYKPETPEEEPPAPEEPTGETVLEGLNVSDYKDYVLDEGSKLTVKVEAEKDTAARSADVDKVEFEATQEGSDNVLTLLTKATCNQLGWGMAVDTDNANVSFSAKGAYSKGSAVVAAAKADGTEFFVSEVAQLTSNTTTSTPTPEDPTDPDGGESDLPTPVNKTALTTAISAAESILGDAIVSADGSEIDPSDQWVTQEDVDTLRGVIEAAQAVADGEEATAEQVSAAVEALNEALATFGSAKQNGTKEEEEVDKTGLNFAMAKAVSAKTGVTVSPNGHNILSSAYWVTPEAMEALEGAIASAQDVANDPEATQDEVDEAIASVNEALEAFNEAKDTGLIFDGGEVELDD